MTARTPTDRAPSLFPSSGEGARTTSPRPVEGAGRGEQTGPSAGHPTTSGSSLLLTAEGPRVLGLDLSITATGIADHTGGHTATRTVRTAVKDYGKDERGTRRRLVHVASTIGDTIATGPRPTLVTVEGPSYGSKGSALHQLAGLWWLVYDHLIRADLPVAVIQPGQLKKYATGKGTADKTAMAVALHRHAGLELGDDNQVDAWWLAAIALERLGRAPVRLPAAQRAALDKVTWPKAVTDAP